MDDIIFADKLKLLDVTTRPRQCGSHAGLGLAHRNTCCRQWTLGTTSCCQGLLGFDSKISPQVATPGVESAVYDCLVLARK